MESLVVAVSHSPHTHALSHTHSEKTSSSRRRGPGLSPNSPEVIYELTYPLFGAIISLARSERAFLFLFIEDLKSRGFVLNMLSCIFEGITA